MDVVLLLVFLLLVKLLSITTTVNGGTSNNNWSKNCRGDWFVYSNSLEQDYFYINRNQVGRLSFCKSLEYCCYATGCFSDYELEEPRQFPRSSCALELLPLGLPKRPTTGRKFLLESGGTNKSKIHNPREENQERQSPFLSPKKTLVMSATGMFLLCCASLCPCFRSKKKEVSEIVLSKDQSSMDPIASLEVSSSSEKLPGSPQQVPGSPNRVPGSQFRVPPSPSRFTTSPRLSTIGSVNLNMGQVIKATQNFSPSLQIGEGGFGIVYKAQLKDGQIVAIKRAKKEHFNTLRAEFSSEVELLAKIEHRNLVRLLGYVDKGNERVIITEFVPNGTLREHLDVKHGKILDFNQRLEISIDVAAALTYLHLYTEKQIIHRDVKSSNILLTEGMRAKVADFGFARFGPTDVDQTHISTKVKGTAGYLDPEYLRTYQLTPKSDVFSFGILLIEILTARRPVEMARAADERVTIRWAFKEYTEGNLVKMLDPLMKERVDTRILSKMFSLAFQCSAPTRSERPNMKEVGEQLWIIRMDYLRSVRRG